MCGCEVLVEREGREGRRTAEAADRAASSADTRLRIAAERTVGRSQLCIVAADAAAMIGSTAFFAPLIATLPDKVFWPSMIILSITHSPYQTR